MYPYFAKLDFWAFPTICWWQYILLFPFFSPVVSLAGFSSCASCFLFWPSLRVFHTLWNSFFLYSNHFCLIINFLLSVRRRYKHDVLNDWMRDYFPHHPLHSVSSSFCRITSKLSLYSFWDNLFLICLTRLSTHIKCLVGLSSSSTTWTDQKILK